MNNEDGRFKAIVTFYGFAFTIALLIVPVAYILDEVLSQLIMHVLKLKMSESWHEIQLHVILAGMIMGMVFHVSFDIIGEMIKEAHNLTKVDRP